ncbi:MAG: dTMP kinase [Clostridia bacterium]|jgi:dTMP kinase|nr:dTMP kinase [Clostridia bacterium]
MRGLFITFEGLDGTGKTTQIHELETKLSELGLPYKKTREPGGTPIAEKIRDIILDPKNTEMCFQAEALLYAASRAQHVSEVIKPALEKGEIVICDRFFDSTLAYQGYARELSLEDLHYINNFAMQEVKPELTFLLDIPAAHTSERINSRELDRLDLEEMDFKNRVRAGFLKIADFEKNRVKVINASLGIQEIHDIIWEKTKSILKEKGMI